MDSEKQLNKLKSIIDVLETDRASIDETAEAFQVVFGIIQQIKDQLDQEIKTNKGEMDDLFSGTLAEFKKLENRIVKVSDRLEGKMGVDNESIRKQLLQEVNTLRGLIPTIPDLTYLEDRISEVEGKIPPIPEIPDEETPEETRDKLETLSGEDRLDASAIKNLPKPGGTTLFGGINQYGGDQRYTKFHEGGSNLTVSDTAPSNPLLNDLWIQI
jgi:hypothetical protein